MAWPSSWSQTKAYKVIILGMDPNDPQTELTEIVMPGQKKPRKKITPPKTTGTLPLLEEAETSKAKMELDKDKSGDLNKQKVIQKVYKRRLLKAGQSGKESQKCKGDDDGELGGMENQKVEMNL